MALLESEKCLSCRSYFLGCVPVCWDLAIATSTSTCFASTSILIVGELGLDAEFHICGCHCMDYNFYLSSTKDSARGRIIPFQMCNTPRCHIYHVMLNSIHAPKVKRSAFDTIHIISHVKAPHNSRGCYRCGCLT